MSFLRRKGKSSKRQHVNDDPVTASPHVEYNVLSDRSSVDHISIRSDKSAEFIKLRGGWSELANVYSVVSRNGEVKKIIDTCGWSRLFNVNVGNGDQKLVLALVERWWDTTHTFHFPRLEIGFTPLDFTFLTGIAFTHGDPPPFDSQKHKQYIPTMNTYFPNMVRRLGTKANRKGYGINLSALKAYILMDHDPTEVEEAARAFMMWIVGQVFFGHASSTVHIGWIDSFIDLQDVSSYNWGGAILGRMYKSLDDCSRGDYSFSGMWMLLEFWFYTYFHTLGPILDPRHQSMDFWPRVLAYNKDRKAIKQSDTGKHSLKGAQEQIEVRSIRSTNWTPYEESQYITEEGVAYARLLSTYRMILFDSEAGTGFWYLGDRCWCQLHGTTVKPTNPPSKENLTYVPRHKYDECVRLGWSDVQQFVEECDEDEFRMYWGRVSIGAMLPPISRAHNREKFGASAIRDPSYDIPCVPSAHASQIVYQTQNIEIDTSQSIQQITNVAGSMSGQTRTLPIASLDEPVSWESKMYTTRKRTSEIDPSAFGLSSLTALSPLDGRYWGKVKGLAPFMSEYGLIRFRVLVEIKWLIKLSQIPEVIEVPSFGEDALSYLEGVIDGFSMSDALEVKKIEKVTNHDVKAVEYFLKQKCQSHPEIEKVLEFFHFACTSEDINNVAQALMLKEALNTVLLPVMDELIRALCKMGKDNADIPMLSRIHGQPATPTTLGKEMAIFATRLSRERHHISKVALLGKFAGAVGNYNAHLVAYPDVNWPRVAKEFVKSLGLSFNPYVTQIEPHDYIGELFYATIRFNTILMDFDRDIWGYASLGYFKQITKAGDVGSSTMPHKVDPIDFENSEGNLGKANAGLSHMSMKLPISRWQPDLTDSTVLRNMGEGLGYSLLAYKSALQGIAKLQVNEARLTEDLDQSWEVLAEPIQTVMRRYGVPEPYEKLKELTRGRAVTKESIREFILGLNLPEDAKANLVKLTPHTYIGEAVSLAKNVDMFVDLENGV